MNLALFLVDGELISSIKEGLCVFVGIGRDDTKKDIEYMLVLYWMNCVTYAVLQLSYIIGSICRQACLSMLLTRT